MIFNQQKNDSSRVVFNASNRKHIQYFCQSAIITITDYQENPMQKFVLRASVTLSLLFLTACATLNQSNQAKNISNARANILTQSNVSHHTYNVLISSGIDVAGCFVDFDLCQQKVNQVFFNQHTKNRLSVLAELNYAYAKHLKNSPNCQGVFSRKPIDEHYPNAYVQTSDTQKAKIWQDEQQCKKDQRQALYNALRYSYAHLFFHKLTGEKSTQGVFVDDESIKSQDLYLIAASDLIDELYQEQKGIFFDAKTHKYPLKQLKNSKQKMLKVSEVITQDDDGQTQIGLYLANDEYLLRYWSDGDDDGLPVLSDLHSVHQQDLQDIGLISTRTGIGVGYVGVLSNRHTSTVKRFSQNRLNSDLSFIENNPTSRIFEPSHLALTGLVIPQGDTLEKVLNSRQFDAWFFNPYHSDRVQILNDSYPLYANFSAGYASWIKENEFDKIALANLLLKNNGQLPELYLLEPYNPNKKVIIMIHGLASSPQTWAKFTNNLLVDPILRERYQVWQIFYATNLPILENRHQIHRLINAAFAKFDPQNRHAASQDAVLIGHSMGGVISRLLVSDSDLTDGLKSLQANDAVHSDKLSKLLQGFNRTDKQAFDARFKLTPLPQVRTAIFISAPHRGTDYADRWFTRTLRKMIGLPIGLSKDLAAYLKQDTNQPASQGVSVLGELYLQNGASQLSDRSAFMQLTGDVKIVPSVRYHSIMANNSKSNQNNNAINDLSGQHISDGIVPYRSSHLDGASSEIVLSGNHSIHESPQSILHLRQILHEHLTP